VAVTPLAHRVQDRPEILAPLGEPVTERLADQASTAKGLPGVSTIVSFHAHPDDEAILCGGTLAKAAAAGHRVVLVYATRGENGEVPDGFLRAGETLTQRRSAETAAAAEILGAARVEFLGYVGSGMRNTATNDAPGSFWRADEGEGARRLEAILAEENADVLTPAPRSSVERSRVTPVRSEIKICPDRGDSLRSYVRSRFSRCWARSAARRDPQAELALRLVRHTPVAAHFDGGGARARVRCPPFRDEDHAGWHQVEPGEREPGELAGIAGLY
jgi:GlcNAc-PI de-N-acetylase